MHPQVFGIFDEICRTHVPARSRVLEIGATSAADTLLNLPALNDAALRVGVNLELVSPLRGTQFVQVAPDGLAAFSDSTFDAVLCNSVLEHDPAFWQTVAGIRRVARNGALIVIGTPGFAAGRPIPALRLARRLARLRGIARLLDLAAPGWEASTPTLVVHNYPGDYYRFSEQAMRDVLLQGCDKIEIRTVLVPPRIIGFGWRAARPPDRAPLRHSS